jgi:hypothetical protein
LSFRNHYVLRGVLNRQGTKLAEFCPLKSCCCFYVAHKTPTACAASTCGERFCPSRRQKGQNNRSPILRTSMKAEPVCCSRGSIACSPKSCSATLLSLHGRSTTPRAQRSRITVVFRGHVGLSRQAIVGQEIVLSVWGDLSEGRPVPALTLPARLVLFSHDCSAPSEQLTTDHCLLTILVPETTGWSPARTRCSTAWSWGSCGRKVRAP